MSAKQSQTPEEGGEATAPKKKLTGKKLILMVVLPLLLIGGGAGYVFMSGMLGGKEEQAEEQPAGPKPIIFVELPDMLVNLTSTGRTPNYLKLRVAIEVDDPAVPPRLEQVMPRVLDSFTVFLRELRTDDLTGSAGMYRVKEELLVRVAGAVAPLTIKDVLFKEMLVQ